ncbi:MAG: peptide deformylase, partial [Bacteroidales bacterium]|nr:peptide deformylase [Bacteroidales bacterium]
GPEGCLSVPGRRGNVLRYRDIDIQYTLPAGSPASGGPSPTRPAPRDTTERIQGFTAVIFQHECDHLDGVLYIDKVIPGSLQNRD